MDYINFHHQPDYEKKVLERLDELILVGRESRDLQKKILEALTKPTETAALKFSPPVLKEK